MAETNIKKLFIHIKKADGQDLTELKNAVVTRSKGNLADRIFFLEDTNELIVKGIAYGLSAADAARITALETGLTHATGAAASDFGTSFVITDDSAIGVYVNKVAGVASADKTVTIKKDDGKAADLSVNIDGKSLVKDVTSGQISVGLDNIIDGATIVKDGDKIKSGLKLVYDSKGSNVDNTTLDHPQMRLVDAAGKTVGTGVDVSDFIKDGLLDSVVYDPAKHSIVFTWNSTAGKDSTSIDISQLFNIEQLHTETSNYLNITKTTPSTDGQPHEGDTKGGICFQVDAKVDNHDLNQGHEIQHTEAAEGTAESYALTSDTALEGQIAGLADAKKVADAIKSVSQSVVALGNARIAAETENKAAIAAEVTTARAAEQANATAIATLNGEGDGSVKKSIKDAIDGLNAEVTGEAQIKGVTNTKPLVTVKVTQADGKVSAVDVTASTDTLTVQATTDAEYTLGTTAIKAKALDAIATADPTLVTLQDAWMYGQCIKSAAVKEVQSDNNDYIKITRENDATKINFEPWAEAHTTAELDNL